MNSLKTIKLHEAQKLSKDYATGDDIKHATRHTIEHEKEAWQQALSRAVTNPKQLFERLQLDSSNYSQALERASEQFSMLVSESYLSRIKPADPNDPLLKQVLPSALENHLVPGYQDDPLDEQAANFTPGMLHKYHGRALLITNSHCAINCRFCFRRNFAYSDNHFSGKHKQAILSYLKEDTSIEELILSGGDPLLLNNRKLAEIISMAETIPHIKRLRIHSRIPLVLPERISDSLLALFRQSPLAVVMVVHCNHPQEINGEIEKVFKRLKQACHALFNQSVLLKGVNDDLDTQIALHTRLFENQVQPYYLHVLDKVKGAAHFDLAPEHIQSLYKGMQEALPGYILPKLAREEAGKAHKTLLIP